MPIQWLQRLTRQLTTDLFTSRARPLLRRLIDKLDHFRRQPSRPPLPAVLLVSTTQTHQLSSHQNPIASTSDLSTIREPFLNIHLENSFAIGDQSVCCCVRPSVPVLSTFLTASPFPFSPALSRLPGHATKCQCKGLLCL